jgi:ribosomal protein S18 acetylase RimI-like enzyme
MMTLAIKTAKASDEAAVVDVLTLAFSVDPAMRWLYPHPHQYITHFPSFVRAVGGKAFAHGSAYCVDGYAGTALWLPPDVHIDEEPLVALLQSTVAEHLHEEAYAVLGQMGSFHPKESHWYLPLIGVDPAHQGNGYGSALMQHALLPCDRDNRPAYLESSSPRNVPLYQRHGFEVLDTIQAGSSPPIFPMLRRARGARA